jgi:hypothetical protein
MISKKLQVEPIGRRLECPTVLNELEENRTNRLPTFQEFNQLTEKAGTYDMLPRLQRSASIYCAVDAN